MQRCISVCVCVWKVDHCVQLLFNLSFCVPEKWLQLLQPHVWMWVSPFPKAIDMERCYFKSASDLQTSVFPVIFSLCVTLRWKRDRAKQIRNQVVYVKSSVSKANPEWAVFAKETEPFGRRVFLLGQHGQVKRVIGAWWNRWDPCGHWHAILPLPPTTGVLCICIKLIEA